PSDLHHQAQASVFALSLVTAVSWPLKAFQDLLRGSQMFVTSAVAEGGAFLIVGAALVGLGLARAPLWILVGVGASAPLTTGAMSAVVARLKRLPWRYSRASVTRAGIGAFFALSINLFITGI